MTTEKPTESGVLQKIQHKPAAVQHKPAAVMFLLFLISVLIYLPSLTCDFIRTWDDQLYVLQNPYIRDFTWQNVKHIFSTLSVGNYFPFHVFSYMFDYAFWQHNAFGYHLVNVLFHACNVALVYLLLLRLGCSRLLALATAAIFAIHPVNVEAVVWVSQRKTVMASFFFLLAFLAFLRYAKTGSRWSYTGTLILFVLSILSKTATLVLPAILLAWLYRQERLSEWWKTLPLFVLSIAGVIAGVWFSLLEKAIDTGTMDANMLFGLIYPTMLAVYPEYLRLLFWPLNLSGFYDTTLFHSFTDPEVLLGILISIVLPITALIFANKNIRFWLLWIIFCFLPMANIIPIQVYYADRYLYLSQIGVFVIVGYLLQGAHKKLPLKLKPWNQKIIAAGILAISLGLVTQTWSRIEKWQNDIVFWEDVISKYPNLYNQRVNLGQAYERERFYAKASQQYLAAYQLAGDPVTLGDYQRVQTLKEMQDNKK